MNIYQQRALEGASGTQLVVALYDGIIRFMREAVAAVERGDASGRRIAVKRAMDILMHLQVTLKMDAGGEVAGTLAEFYAAMFALMLQGSTTSSKERFEQVIREVLNVRGAWQQVATGVPAGQDEARPVAGEHRGDADRSQRYGTIFESQTRDLQPSAWTA